MKLHGVARSNNSHLAGPNLLARLPCPHLREKPRSHSLPHFRLPRRAGALRRSVENRVQAEAVAAEELPAREHLRREGSCSIALCSVRCRVNMNQ